MFLSVCLPVCVPVRLSVFLSAHHLGLRELSLPNIKRITNKKFACSLRTEKTVLVNKGYRSAVRGERAFDDLSPLLRLLAAQTGARPRRRPFQAPGNSENFLRVCGLGSVRPCAGTGGRV